MLKSKPYNRWTLVDQNFRSLFVTFFLIELTNRGSGIIDGLFVSNFFDTDSIASVGIAKPIYSLISIITGLVTVGTQSKCSYELGKGDIKGFNRIFSSMFYITAFISAVFTAALLLCARPLAMLMGASGEGAELADGATLYLRGIGIGFPALILTPFISSLCQLDNAKNRVRKSSLVYFCGNCLFDLLAVKCGFGILGIGLATTFGMYMQLTYLLLHFRTNERMLKFTKFNISISEVKETLSLGTEKSLRALNNFIVPVIGIRIVLFFGGTIAVTAASVQKDLFIFTEILASALANATALQTGIYFGEMSRENLHAMGRIAHKLCFIFVGIAGVVLVLFSKPIAGLYISEQGELFKMVVFSCVMTGLYAPLNGLVRSRISYLNAIKKTRNMQIMIILSSIVYAISGAFILGALFGAYGLFATDTIRAVMLLITVWTYYSIKTKGSITKKD